MVPEIKKIGSFKGFAVLSGDFMLSINTLIEVTFVFGLFLGLGGYTLIKPWLAARKTAANSPNRFTVNRLLLPKDRIRRAAGVPMIAFSFVFLAMSGNTAMKEFEIYQAEQDIAAIEHESEASIKSYKAKQAAKEKSILVAKTVAHTIKINGKPVALIMNERSKDGFSLVSLNDKHVVVMYMGNKYIGKRGSGVFIPSGNHKEFADKRGTTNFM